MNYENMSDFEVNAAVSMHVLWKNRHCEEVDCNDKTGAVSWADGANWHEFNPCNNPSDAWPIMLENSIGIARDTRFFCDDPQELIEMDTWEASHCIDGVYCNDKNPLRAAMIVFLMMQEAKRG